MVASSIKEFFKIHGKSYTISLGATIKRLHHVPGGRRSKMFFCLCFPFFFR